MKKQNLKKQQELKIDMKEKQWLPINCAPKDGSSIIVKENANKRHKIFKAQWFLNKWFSLYENGGNEEVHPEFWLEGSKEEPKIDMKEECVDPASIWKDVSELPRCLDGAAVFYKRDGQTFIGEAHSFGVIAIYPDSNSEHLNNEDIDKVCLVGDFINSLEQMQKDIQELKKCQK